MRFGVIKRRKTLIFSVGVFAIGVKIRNAKLRLQVNETMDSKKKVKRLIGNLLSRKGVMHDIALYTKLIVSLTREEVSAMYRYHEIIRFISAIQVYNDILFILAKDRTKLGKNTFKKILAIRNKIVREHRIRIKKDEELFKEIRTSTKKSQLNEV